MKRKLLCAVLLGLVLLTGCKKDSSDIDTVSSVKTEDTVLISVLEKYPEVDFESEEEIETIYISDQAAEWKEDFDTSDYENYTENVEEFCDSMDELLDEEIAADRILGYEKSDFCYIVTLPDGSLAGYTIPAPDEFLAGDSEINNVLTIWPCRDDRVARQADGAIDAAAIVKEGCEINDVISYEFGKKEDFGDLVEPWLNIKPGDIVIVESHGTHNSKENSMICIGQKVEKSSIYEYADNTNFAAKTVNGSEWNSAFIPLDTEVSVFGKTYMDLYISKNFFETFYRPGDLEGTVFYFGTCGSMKDNKLASTLCDLGADLVIGWDALIYSYYEKESCTKLFEFLSQGETVSDAIQMTKDALYHKYNETLISWHRGTQNAWAEMFFYPEDSTYVMTDEMRETNETTKPEAEQPNVQEPVTLSPEDLTNIDYSQMKETYLGDVTLIYDDSYNESVSVGKVPNYSIYLGELADVFPDYPSLSSADMGNYDAHPEFMQDGVIVPLVHFRSDRYITEVTEANQFLFDNATQQQYDEFFGLHSWGLLPNMPEAFREPLEEIMNWAIGEYWIEKEELIGLAMKGTEDYEYIDEKGREVFGFDMGNSTYYDGQRIIETDEYNLHACISIGFDYTYPYNEHPHNEDIYFSIETENGIQHYKMEMVGLSTTQTSELNRIAYEENRFAKALEYWHVFNNYFGMEVELYLLTE